MKILLIEDSKFQRVANERALVKAGYSVIQAGTAKRVSVLLARTFPILILLDMMLPKVSGLDVLRALKADVFVKHIPVIVLSGLGQANATKLLKEGAAAFFMKSEKPFENSSSALIQAVESVLTQSKNIVATAAH
jgi:CheY-like chemotaxis protein